MTDKRKSRRVQRRAPRTCSAQVTTIRAVSRDGWREWEVRVRSTGALVISTGVRRHADEIRARAETDLVNLDRVEKQNAEAQRPAVAGTLPPLVGGSECL